MLGTRFRAQKNLENIKEQENILHKNFFFFFEKPGQVAWQVDNNSNNKETYGWQQEQEVKSKMEGWKTNIGDDSIGIPKQETEQRGINMLRLSSSWWWIPLDRTK